jgi:DNA-binding response OmpR family regulator
MTSPGLAGRSILIVEDEALIAYDLASAFEHEGAVVTTTTTLRQALILAKLDGLSAVVVDHVLGDGDTQELCTYLRDHGVPYVLYSGFGRDEVRHAEDIYVAKPTPVAVVVALIKKLLETGTTRGMDPLR